jgi:hypothetical protein
VTADADRPADVRITGDVIAAYHRWKGRRHSLACLSCRGELAALFTALSTAGLAVVPAGEQREEWGVDGAPFEDGEENARRIAARNSGSQLVRRTVHVGPWVPVDRDEDEQG